MGSVEACTEILWGNLREKGDLENPDVDGRIILKYMLNRLK